jgi:hypothetical protein
MGAITNDLSLARLHMLVNCCFLTQLQQMVDFVVFHYYCISYFVQVHKELKDAMTQLDTIRYEVQSLSRLTPGQFTTKQNNPGNYKLSLQ